MVLDRWLRPIVTCLPGSGSLVRGTLARPKKPPPPDHWISEAAATLANERVEQSKAKE